MLTAVMFQMDTRDFVPLTRPGAPIYGIEATTGGNLVIFEGRVPGLVVATATRVSADFHASGSGQGGQVSS